jgi:hypothetical protein
MLVMVETKMAMKLTIMIMKIMIMIMKEGRKVIRQQHTCDTCVHTR